MKNNRFESFSKPYSKKDVRKEIEVGRVFFERPRNNEDWEDMRAYLKGLGRDSEYADMLEGLGESGEISYENIEYLNSLKDTLERLKCLRNMPLVDAIEYLTYYTSGKGGDFLSSRLKRYQDLLDTGIDSDSIKRGLLRDTLFAEMQGTPEMGALKIANKKLKKGVDNQKIATLFGYYSGIFDTSDIDSER